jgi:5-methyltetrahydrofolate--homocysteine methyltransferase
MKTLLRSETKEVQIDTEGPIVIIGEKINPTGHKKLATAYKEGDFDYVKLLASRQIAAGADVLDVNVGVPGIDEAALLPEVVKIVASEVEAPICLDSADPDTLAAALPQTPGKPLINSVNGEEATLNTLLPIVKDHNAAVIGLTMDDEGIPNDAETRLAIAGKILERAAKVGIPIEDVVIDPLAMAVGADSNAAVVTLRAIELIRGEFGVNINLGASNISFGLPERHNINEAFLALAASAGATCVITDPMKHTLALRAIDLLLGRDAYSARYIGHYRARTKESD